MVACCDAEADSNIPQTPFVTNSPPVEPEEIRAVEQNQSEAFISAARANGQTFLKAGVPSNPGKPKTEALTPPDRDAPFFFTEERPLPKKGLGGIRTPFSHD